MNIKKCSKCGWIFPATFKPRRCKFCGTYFPMGYCACCGEWSEKLRPANNRCQKCETRDFRNWRQNRANKRATELDEWLKKIGKIPYPYHTLTEDEWLEACKHFGGCAYCGDSDISARSMFIPFKMGGKYCAWNIVPSCEKCETSIKVQENPFIRMDNGFNVHKDSSAKRLGLTLGNLQKIVDYLQTKMEVK